LGSNRRTVNDSFYVSGWPCRTLAWLDRLDAVRRDDERLACGAACNRRTQATLITWVKTAEVRSRDSTREVALGEDLLVEIAHQGRDVARDVGLKPAQGPTRPEARGVVREVGVLWRDARWRGSTVAGAVTIPHLCETKDQRLQAPRDLAHLGIVSDAFSRLELKDLVRRMDEVGHVVAGRDTAALVNNDARDRLAEVFGASDH
jgi:hypothetical protein